MFLPLKRELLAATLSQARPAKTTLGRRELGKPHIGNPIQRETAGARTHFSSFLKKVISIFNDVEVKNQIWEKMSARFIQEEHFIFIDLLIQNVPACNTQKRERIKLYCTN